MDPSKTETVRDILLLKHPPKQPPKPSAIVTTEAPPTALHLALFENIDGQLIQKVALKVEGAAGPSGLDASGKRLCSSYKSSSSDLCSAIASIAKKLCTNYVDPQSISAFTACRLIALDKKPGVRPIGIGETIRRIVNKAIALALRDDIQDAAGALQVCAGQLSGCEAAVHAMHKIFESPETEAAILVDASNAFNSLNRQSPSITFITYVPHCRRYSPTRIKKISTSTSMGKPSIPKRAPPRETLWLWLCMP